MFNNFQSENDTPSIGTTLIVVLNRYEAWFLILFDEI